MKRFSSYGPPDPETEFMVQRPALVQRVMDQLVGDPNKGGHYFTIFAPRQVGKTTTLRQAVARLRELLGDSFHVGMATLHNVHDFRQAIPRIFKLAFGMDVNEPEHWEAVQALFSHTGPLKKPTLLILDEFDGLPGPALAETVAMFRQLYLEREATHLHGLALIGVHAVLGELTSTMSPFNVQRSVNIPNLTRDEVFSLYAQYTAETGQHIDPEGITRIYDMFRGQPGLTCWFGELLTEKRNLVQPPPWMRKEGPPPEGYPPITLKRVEDMLELAQYSEININIRNLTSKGMAHQELLQTLFVSHTLRFNLNKPDLQWLYLNGIIVGQPESETSMREVCAFASPFVQACLFSAFGDKLTEAYHQEELTLVTEGRELGQARAGLDIPLLLTLYRRFLGRRVAKGSPPWVEQPVRSDARPFEAIGHFNLYAWLYNVAKDGFVVVPEFPTGNGTADLLLTNTPKGRLTEVLEIKSFTNTSDLDKAVEQAARYARKLTLLRSYLVVMADVSAYEMLRTAPTQYETHGVKVTLEVIPWGFWPEGAALAGPDQTHGLGGTGASTVSSSTAVQVRALGADPRTSLEVEDRLALELLLAPLLTPPILRRLWGRSGMTPPPVSEEDLLEQWDALLNRCLLEHKLTDLVKILCFTYPELKTEPLLERLQRMPAR